MQSSHVPRIGCVSSNIGYESFCSINRSSSFPIKPRTHFFSGLEERKDSLCDLHFSAGLGIAPLARSANLGRKGSETPKLDSISATQSFDDFVKYRVDDVLYVSLVKVRVLRSDAPYQVGFYHIQPRITGWQIGQMSVKQPSLGFGHEAMAKA
jgi:hypothetical protein